MFDMTKCHDADDTCVGELATDRERTRLASRP
jgi:hypothetical protein